MSDLRTHPADQRPQLGSWAPGNYTCLCLFCSSQFIGDKRALECANCAYSPEGAERRANAQARLSGKCSVCGSAEHRFRQCPDLTSEARKVFGGPPPIPDATRHWGSVKCVDHLRELEAEAKAPTPSPTSLRLLAGAVARDCPQAHVTLAGPVVRLADGLAGLVACWGDLCYDRRPGRFVWLEAGPTLASLREALQSACVALRVQVEAAPTALIEEVAHV